MKDEGVFCREAEAGLERLFDHAFERELIIPFGATGYIVGPAKSISSAATAVI